MMRQAVRSLLRQWLKEDGHTVVEAADGYMALDCLHQQPFDLVFLDIFMPLRDGIETLSAIRKEGYLLPVIAMSGGGGKEAMDFLTMVEKLGANASLRKPFQRSELLGLLARLLE